MTFTSHTVFGYGLGLQHIGSCIVVELFVVMCDDFNILPCTVFRYGLRLQHIDSCTKVELFIACHDFTEVVDNLSVQCLRNINWHFLCYAFLCGTSFSCYTSSRRCFMCCTFQYSTLSSCKAINLLGWFSSGPVVSGSLDDQDPGILDVKLWEEDHIDLEADVQVTELPSKHRKRRSPPTVATKWKLTLAKENGAEQDWGGCALST